jgi:hypothetical protein
LSIDPGVKIKDVKVTMTIFDGEIVYEKNNRTRMTQIKQMCTDKICENQPDLCNCVPFLIVNVE